jgi:hypothetical protein
MDIEEIVAKIKGHPKFNALHWIQQQRVVVAAAWTKHCIQTLPLDRKQVLSIVKNHKTHKEFKGILFDIISNY